MRVALTLVVEPRKRRGSPSQGLRPKVVEVRVVDAVDVEHRRPVVPRRLVELLLVRELGVVGDVEVLVRCVGLKDRVGEASVQLLDRLPELAVDAVVGHRYQQPSPDLGILRDVWDVNVPPRKRDGKV